MTEEIIIDGVNVAGCEYYFEDNGVIAPDGTPERANLCTSPEKSCENSDSCYCNKGCYYKQLKRLQETLKHAENGRKAKANKLKRIEEIVTHCIQGGFTDEFVQEIFDICREYEEV